MKNKPIIFFDGVCVLCNNSVQFILKKERKPYYYFASLQSEFGQNFLKEHQLKTENFNSMILFEDGKLYQKSTAVLRMFKSLNFPYSVGFILLLIPKFIRDFFYDFVARNRYQYFGKEETCRIPDKKLRERMLD